MAVKTFAELLLDESPDALIAIGFDGVVLSWNRGAERIFGYAADEAIGRNLDALVVPHDRRGEARAALEEAIHAGGTTLHTVRRRKDGVLIEVDVTKRRADPA